MKLTTAERLHHAWYGDDGRVNIRYWNHRINDKPGFVVDPNQPGDGLRTIDRDRVAPGYVLYSPDHSRKFLLLDLDGKIVHEWPAWTSHFGYLLPNGHLLLDTEFSPDRELGSWLHPVEQMTWGRADSFTRRLGLELPDEVHWEYAARGGTDEPKWWCGDDPDVLARSENLEGTSDGHEVTSPVGSFLPNPYGLHDVHGNVAEWCSDQIENGRLHVARGGEFRSEPLGAGFSCRFLLGSTLSTEGVGLRPMRRVERE